MSASQYPNNNDDSFNSFVITNDGLVNRYLGRSYTQNELVPISQTKFFEKNGAAPSYAPIQILSIPCKPSELDVLQNEYIYKTISETSVIAENNIFQLYQNLLVNAAGYTDRVDVVLVIATPFNNTSVCSHPANNIANQLYTIFLNYRLTWFVPQNSVYA